jgi:hypothetical protein
VWKLEKLHTSYLSFICAEQTVWVKPYFGDDSNIKKTLKPLPETSGHLSRCQNACFMRWCFKCLSTITILKVMEEGRVSIGIFHTCYFSLDVRRTECAGQTICSVMVPASRKNRKTIAGKTLRTSDHPSPCQKTCFRRWCFKCFSITKSEGKERGEYRSISNQLNTLWCA